MVQLASWAFGGKLVDANNKVVIDSAATARALENGEELYATFIPGSLSWLDPNIGHQQRHLPFDGREELAGPEPEGHRG